MSMNILPYIGKRFGWLMVLGPAHPKQGHQSVECSCECGQRVIVWVKSLITKHTSSCGCFARKLTSIRATTHGHTKSRKLSSEFQCWMNMKHRCLNPKWPGWKSYGGRGIKVCKEWEESFEAFLIDMGNRPSQKHSIERINNDGNYEPRNCKWATLSEQAKNKRGNRLITHGGITLCCSEWDRKLGFRIGTVSARILKSGWSNERAVTTPKMRQL